MKPFKCIKCGKCCSEIREKPPKGIKFPFMNGPVVYLENPHLIIYEWELPALKKIASGKGIEFDTKPFAVIFDLDRKVSAAISYSSTKQPCPFLGKDNNCLAYESRPLTCRSFPAPSFVLQLLYENRMDLNITSMCPGLSAADEIIKHIVGDHGNMVEKGTAIGKAFSVFGESLAFRAQFDNVMAVETGSLMKLAKDGKIRHAKPGYDPEMLAKRIQKSRLVPLTSFYEMIGLSDERKTMVQGFKDGYEKFIGVFKDYKQKLQ